MNTLFSVIIAVYNREKYLYKAIDSVLSQTFKDYELIVVDDGSTDGTWDTISSYGSKLRGMQKINQGSEATYIYGVSAANGKYIAFLDSDDYFMPYALATYAAIIKKESEPPLIMGFEHRYYNDGDDEVPSSADDRIRYFRFRDYFSKNMTRGLAQSLIVMRKDMFHEVDTVIYKNEKYVYRRCLNDYNLILQSGMFSPCCIIDSPVTVAYRQHAEQNSLKIDLMSNGVLELIAVVKKGTCYGGKNRKFDKYAYLAGPILEWTGKSWKKKNLKMVVKLILRGWLMVLAGILKKISMRFKKIEPIILQGDRNFGKVV